MSYIIMTDTSANLPTKLLKERGIPAVPFSYYVNGEECTCEDTDAFDGVEYYTAIQKGSLVNTSQINPQRFIDWMTPYLKDGQDILYIGMSSGISGAYNSSEMAAAMLREEFPERKVFVFDTRAASLGEGILVIKAADAKDSGESIESVYAALDTWQKQMYQVFCVDDLIHLKRTGRISNLAAIVGVVLHIKPILKGNEKGQIVVVDKIRGFRKAMQALAERYDELVLNPAEQIVGIAHANAKAYAEALADMLRATFPPKEIMIVDYEPVTGSHVGPGTVALFFMGNEEVRAM